MSVLCTQHTRTTAPTIEKELLASGEIRHVFFSFPLDIHPKAQKASEAAECAAKQGRFWEMHKSLFTNPTDLEPSALTKRAESLGLNTGEFVSCLESGQMADAVRRGVEAGRRLTVNSTPAFFVGLVRRDGSIDLIKRINGARPFGDFEDAITEAIKRADDEQG